MHRQILSLLFLICLLFAGCTSSTDTIEDRRNLGEKMGLLGALVGVISVAASYYHLHKKVSKLNHALAKEKEKSEQLLLNILPESIAQELKEKGKANAQHHDVVTVLFTDFKDFTKISELLSPSELVRELDECFTQFDSITEKYHIEKIKVIGDSYMAVGGLKDDEQAVDNVVLAALEMQKYIERRKSEKEKLNQPYFLMRAGIHTGAVSAGVTGSKKFQYDIWGDTVNVASRMESSGEAGKVNISGATYQMIKDNSSFSFIRRGEVEAKNKGMIEMYFVEKKVERGLL